MNLANEFFAGRTMVTVGEVAKRLGVSVTAIENWLRAGVPVPYFQLGGVGRVFDINEVVAWYDKATDGRTHPVQFPPPNRTQPQAVVVDDGIWHPQGSRVYGRRNF